VTPTEDRRSTDLMRLAQQGDATAYAELLLLLTDVARRYARGRLGDVAWIDDVVQETLISVHRARATYDARRPFAPWFYAITANRLIDVLRRERRIATREQTGESSTEPAASPSAEGTGGATIDVDAVLAAVRALPPRQREVVQAMKLRGESARAVGERLGMSRTAVKVTAHRGYEALRRMLGVKRS
jgi:RNA polymerase sigma-70 factor (ECF subfamily)